MEAEIEKLSTKGQIWPFLNPAGHGKNLVPQMLCILNIEIVSQLFGPGGLHAPHMVEFASVADHTFGPGICTDHC